MLIVKQFVAARMEEFAMRIQRHAHAPLGGREKSALIAASLVFMEPIAHRFVNVSMERLVNT